MGGAERRLRSLPPTPDLFSKQKLTTLLVATKHRVEGWPATLASPAAQDSRRVQRNHLHGREPGEEQTRRASRFLVWHVGKARHVNQHVAW